MVKNILHVLHEKRYEDLPSCVDEMEWDDTDQIRDCIQGTLDMNDFDVFDEYGVPCTFSGTPCVDVFPYTGSIETFTFLLSEVFSDAS